MNTLELVYDDNNIELRYFENSDRYRSWTLSKFIINELIPWWRDTKFNICKFPVIKIEKYYEFNMVCSRYIYIKEFDGNTNCLGSWDIPIVVIEALSEMEKEGITKKNL
jgi:hypothetical protein